MGTADFDLLFGGGYAIKDYYMESGNPRQMRGASELLNACTAEIKKLLETSGIAEDRIIQSGATLSALVPRGNGALLAAEAEAIFRKKCRTASAAFVSVPYNGAYIEMKKRALDAYEQRKAEKFIPWEIQDAPSILPDFPSKDAPARCPRCRLRTPRFRIAYENGEVQYLCDSCAKRERKSCNRNHDMRRECGDEFDYDNYEISTTTDLADGDGRICLLYADVNDLGGQSGKTSFEEDKAFHEKVQEAVENAVHSAIRTAMKLDKKNHLDDGQYRAKFEVIALGGDDVCLLLPGNIALFTAWKIAEEFDKSGLGLTISVAACVANDTTALTYMEKISQSALEYGTIKGHNGIEKETAKRLAHRTKKSVIQLSFFENPSDMFPMTREKAGRFIALLREANDSAAATALRTVSEARRELIIDEEFALFFDYYKSREATKGSSPILQKIRKTYSDIKDPWRDFITWRGQKLGRETGDKR